MKERTGPHLALANAILAERSRRDQSQYEASVEIGTTQQSFGKWENGVSRPSDDHVAALAKYLGMTQDKVRELRGPMRVDPLDRQVLKRRVEELEARMDRQAEQSAELIRRLEQVATRLDALDARGD